MADEGDLMCVASSLRTNPPLERKIDSETPWEASLDGRWRYRKPLSKLEVLRSRQVDRITWVNLFIFSFGLVWSVSFLIWARAVSFETLNRTTSDGRKVRIPSYNTNSPVQMMSEYAAGMTQSTVALGLAPIYFLRVFRNNKLGVTTDQVMVGVFLAMNFFGANPVYMAYLLNDYLVHPNNPEKQWRGLSWFKPVNILTLASTHASWACGILLYVWIRLHIFSIFKKLTRWELFKHVILPKLFIALLYWTLTITASAKYNSAMGFLPFTSLINVLVNRRVTGGDHTPFALVICACCMTALELVMLSGILITTVRTNKVLRPLNYFLYRSQIVAFRFFVVHNLMYISGFILNDNLTAIVIPPGVRLRTTFLHPQYFPLHNMENTVGMFLMKTVWIIVTTYVSLPPDSMGFRGWFKPCDEATIEEIHRDEAEPVTFSLDRSPVTAPSIFGFLDASFMLNLAWLAYKKDREEMDLYAGQLATPDKFEVITEEEFDTKVILANLPDRIAIAFRGTTTTANIMTDLKVALDLVNDFLPSRHVNTLEKASTKAWRAAKLHHGFAAAYQAVAEKLLTRIEQLLSEHRRPVYLTGHSLGGALATVCSLDLVLCDIGLNADRVTVITFGSPRCGNEAWSAMYNRMVSSNWNVKIESDVVTMLPRFPYTHVGKTALFTRGGNLLLDPSALDSTWSSELPSIHFHKKQAYKMGFSIVCEKHLQGMDTGIWAFPVAEHEVKLWEKKAAVTFSEKSFSSLVSPIRKK